LNRPGTNTGPPSVYPESFLDVLGGSISGVTRLLVQLFAFQSDRRPYQ
jgi:hypothetical protein